jgi:hypothetical protein
VGDLIKVLQEAKQEIPVDLLKLEEANQSYRSTKNRFDRSGSFSGQSRYNK